MKKKSMNIDQNKYTRTKSINTLIFAQFEAFGVRNANSSLGNEYDPVSYVHNH